MANEFSLFDSYSENMPRERLINYGASILSDAELLSILLRSGGRGVPVISLANKLLLSFGNFKGLLDCDIHDLVSNKDVGVAKAASIKAACEIALRIGLSKGINKDIKAPEDIYALVRKEIYSKDKEHLFVISLDSRMKLISVDLLSIGTVNETLIHPREVFKVALSKNAVSIALVHNHPSNDPTPSDQDILLTSKIYDACLKVGLYFIDHVVACDDSFSSLKALGYIGKNKFNLKGGENS